MQVAISHDMRCLKKPSPVDKICSFGCPFGYFLRDDPNRGSFRFVCQKNGTWGGENHTCVGKFIKLCEIQLVSLMKPGDCNLRFKAITIRGTAIGHANGEDMKVTTIPEAHKQDHE